MTNLEFLEAPITVLSYDQVSHDSQEKSIQHGNMVDILEIDTGQFYQKRLLSSPASMLPFTDPA